MREAKVIKEKHRCNDLSGKEWLQNSISVWRGLDKTREEKNLAHPALFPVSLCEKLIRTFSPAGAKVLDPFNGVGSTMTAAHNLNQPGIGIDLSESYCETARKRVSDDESIEIICGDSQSVLDTIQAECCSLCVTSPPYWDILRQKRSVDHKNNICYSDSEKDLGNISDYGQFLFALGEVFGKVHHVLQPGSYCLVNVMDLRKKSVFYPLHSDLAAEMQKRGYVYDDLLIWDRQSQYNNLRPLGYPYKFRVNKVHEYVLIFIRP